MFLFSSPAARAALATPARGTRRQCEICEQPCRTHQATLCPHGERWAPSSLCVVARLIDGHQHWRQACAQRTVDTILDARRGIAGERPEPARDRLRQADSQSGDFRTTVGVDDAGEDVAFDELLLAAGGLAERCGGEAVDVTKRAVGGLVHHGQAVGGEELPLAAGALEAVADVLAGVLGGERLDGEPVGDARVERAVVAQLQPRLELWCERSRRSAGI